MNSHQIKEAIIDLRGVEPERNLRPTDMDRMNVRAQQQLTLAVLEVALQLAVIVEDGFPGIENALRDNN